MDILIRMAICTGWLCLIGYWLDLYIEAIIDYWNKLTL